MVYAIVRAGGRQEKVEVGTVVTLDRIKADENGNVQLAPVLLVDGDKVTTNKDFDNLSSQIAQATPSGVPMNSYTPTNTKAATCPSVNSDWRAPSDPLPPPVNAQLCSCMSKSVACAVADNVAEKDYGTLFGVACGAQGGKFCAGINRNVTSDGGSFGAYGMCSSEDQLNFALNAYYEGTGKKADTKRAIITVAEGQRIDIFGGPVG